MDRPLLALTRPRPGPPPETPATANLQQLVQLRWLAVGGQLVTILLVTFALGVPLPLGPMLATVALLAGINWVATVLLPRHRVTDGEIFAGLLLDMGVLTAQLYLSGGVANPFTSFYLLQLVLGAILLARGYVWLLLAVASLCYVGLTMRFVPLAYPPALMPALPDLQTFGAWVAFVLTAALLGLFVTRITRNLRARERYLADLRQQAMEEDAIVRMGLFASGAAHELGTPLASLSVILGDWRRVPKLAGDPELAGEVEEMLAEVERCKEIVTDILHSAGEPRGETIGTASAQAFLDEVVAAWRPTHATVPLDYRAEGLAGAALVAGASLRQAIWNLLDNAAEASPDAVGLTATVAANALSVTVADAGPGFAPEQLAALGKPAHSRKGAGHGVGLFLTATVVRRLGGQLVAANRPGGGAAVTLNLPLAATRHKER